MPLRALKKALAEKKFGNAIDACWAYAKLYPKLPIQETNELVNIYNTDPNPLKTHAIIALWPYIERKHFKSICNGLLCSLVDQDRCELSLVFLRTLQLANAGTLEIEYNTLEKLMLAAKYHSDVDFAWQAVRSMQATHKKLYSRTWGLFLSLVLDQEHYEALKFIWQEAATPGYVTIDDCSYTKMAKIASQHGDIQMCDWAISSIQDRCAYFNIKVENSLQLTVYAIEAAATHSLLNGYKSSMRTCLSLLVKTGDSAGRIAVSRLKNLVKVLDHPKQQQYMQDIYAELLEDPRAHEMVKTLFFNVILKHKLSSLYPHDALHHYHKAREAQVELNEDSVLLLLQLGQDLEDPWFQKHILEQEPASSSRVCRGQKYVHI